jgi:hypothetical protein
MVLLCVSLYNHFLDCGSLCIIKYRQRSMCVHLIKYVHERCCHLLFLVLYTFCFSSGAG